MYVLDYWQQKPPKDALDLPLASVRSEHAGGNGDFPSLAFLWCQCMICYSGSPVQSMKQVIRARSRCQFVVIFI